MKYPYVETWLQSFTLIIQIILNNLCMTELFERLSWSDRTVKAVLYAVYPALS